MSSEAAASNLVLKASAGNLYSLTITIGATSGYAMLFDATSLPSNGAVTPVWCYPVTSNGTNGTANHDNAENAAVHSLVRLHTFRENSNEGRHSEQ